MKVTKFFSFAIALLVIFSACNDNQYDGVQLPAEEREAGEITVSLLDATGLLTRGINEVDPAEGSPEERKINSVIFYIFNAVTGERDGNFPEYKPTGDVKTRFTFPVSAGSKTILVAINTGAESISGNLQDVEKALYEKAIINPTSFDASVGIPMSGSLRDLEVEEGEVTPATIEVSRMYARFNAPTADGVRVTVDTNGKEYEELALIAGRPISGNLKFDLTGHVVINGLTKSYLYPNYGVVNPDVERWEPGIWTIGGSLTNYTPSEYENNQLGNVYSGDDFLGNEDVVYLYENSPKWFSHTETGSISGFHKNSIYSLIIEGDLSDNNGHLATRYWRINVSNTKETESMYQIIRNAIYKVNIQNVKTIGYGTPGEAEEGGGEEIIPDADEAVVEVSVKLISWRVFEENTDI